MDEENTQPTPAEPVEATTEEQAPVEDATPEVAAETPTPEAPVYDWRKALDDAPTEELRRHPKFAGIVGSEKQTWQQQWANEQQARADADARTKAEQELRDLAQQNPVAFADKWLSSEEARQQQDRLTALEASARQQIATSIGAAMHAIPEWADVAGDAEAQAYLMAQVQGKGPDEILPAWNKAAIELVTARRARALAEKLVADRLTAERAAWETEAAAQGLVRSDRPDLVRGGRVANADPEPDDVANPREWHAWYRRNTPGAA